MDREIKGHPIGMDIYRSWFLWYTVSMSVRTERQRHGNKEDAHTSVNQESN